MRKIFLWFVDFTCSYLLTLTKISGFVQKISAVCVFCLSVLAYLAKYFRTHTQNHCGLWFLLVDTCLLACLLTWPSISGLVLKINVFCVFCFLLLVTCYLLLVLVVTCYLLLVTYYLLLVTCYLLLVTCYLLLVTCYALLVTCYSLFLTFYK